MQLISIHALREEGDTCWIIWRVCRSNFYPRPPRGGRPCCLPNLRRSAAHFYPRPPRGGRRPCFRPSSGPLRISIHALREEGDKKTVSRNATASKFLSTPSARRATEHAEINSRIGQFLSTPSARRATWTGRSRPAICGYFYPRPPRGGRRTSDMCI